MKGKKYLDLKWVKDYKEGSTATKNNVDLCIPAKSWYSYYGIENIILPEEVSWEDYAEAVLELLNLDLSKSKRFRVYKSKLNL